MERTRLILQRKSGQSLVVGDADIQFVVKGKSIRLVIEAPRELKIVRKELTDGIRPLRICGDGTTPPVIPAGTTPGT